MAEQLVRPRPAMDVLEDALNLLRTAEPATIAARLVGDVPFSLGILYFLTDMTRNPFAAERLSLESLAVAVLFAWKNVWQAIFMAHIHGQLSAGRVPSINLARLIAIQSGIQPLALIVIPLALLATVPFAWAVAFFRNAGLLAALGETQVVLRARQQSSLWSRQNWQILGSVALAGLLLFANVLIAIVLVPQIARSLLGMEGEFTRLGLRILNLTTVMIAASVTWLMLDPLLDAVYVVRCFYGASLRTGEDLHMRLKEIIAAMALSAALISVLSIPAVTVHAQNAAPPQTASAQYLDAARLDQSIGRVIRQPEFAWRSPRPPGPEAQGKWANWLRSALKTIDEGIDWLARKIAGWFRSEPSPVENGSGNAPTFTLKLGLIAIGVVLVGALVAAFMRRRKQSPVQAHAAAAASAAPVELADESVTADQLPEDSWRKLAAELAERGEYRKALRALYLSGLNYLSSRELISIRRWKSGLDYRRELDRRVRANSAVRPELSAVVQHNIALFELGWYGAQNVGPAEIDAFLAGLDQMRMYAELP